MTQISELEAALNDFNPAVRTSALEELVALAQEGEVELTPAGDVANMHCHTFYSFNAYGHSPTSLAWLGKRRGFRLTGIIDFDVLDGVDEFLDACQLVGMRGSAGIESRVFVPEYASQEINSPGEPGVCYHMGIGFTSSQVPESVSAILADLGQRAAQRNKAIADLVNDYLSPATINYDQDVVPLSPGGSPTERHMVVAYIQAAERTVPDPAGFWVDRLGVAPDQMAEIMADAPGFQNLIRAKLMKRGGVGYVQPASGMFPSLENYHEMIVACGALPCAAWLDGTTATEKKIEDWLRFLVDRGVVALNIVPDRNWNIADPEVRRLKVENLYQVVEVAQTLDLVLNVGTEMNSFGQKLIDDFDAPELQPLRGAFLDGATLVYGHTMLQRALGLGYQSEWALVHLPTRAERNEFYRWAGTLIPPGRPGVSKLRRPDPIQPPAQILSTLNEQ